MELGFIFERSDLIFGGRALLFIEILNNLLTFTILVTGCIIIMLCYIMKIYNRLFSVGGSKTSYTSLNKLTNLCKRITGNKIKIGKMENSLISV